MKTETFVRHASWCDVCGKRSYLTRPMAKTIARRMNTHYTVYPCPDSTEMWHVGRLARDIIEGKITRDEYYGNVVS